MKTLDMRGEPCPIPVVNAKKALAEKDAAGVVVLVDNIIAAQNLEKMAKGSGFAFSYTEEGHSVYKAVIVKSAADNGPAPAPAPAPAQTQAAGAGGGGTAVLITADSMGRGAEDLGRILIKGFIFSLSQLDTPPEAVIFLNGGAHLTAEGAASVSDLKALEEKGTRICTCGTCANYYKLTESLAVGSIVDMMTISTLLAKASRVITI
jgi:selenium metabolism protein YedF